MINHFFKKTLNKFGFNELSFYSINVSNFTVSITDFIKADYYLSNGTLKKILFDLFFFGRNIDRTKLKKVFSVDEVKDLINHDIIQVNEEKARSLVRIVFFEKYLFVCDFPFRYENSEKVIFNENKDQVFIPHFDSYYFTNFIKVKSKQTLDVGTGSGFLAIVVSQKSGKVVGVDINKRAIEYAKLNKKINSIENVEFRKGNLFDPVKGEKFDLIISNPPHGVNHPVLNKPIAVDGGADGLFFTRKIINESSKYLNDGGTVMTSISIGGDSHSNIKNKLIKLLNKKNINLFHLTSTFSSSDYALINFRNHLIVDGLSKTTKKIYKYAKYLDKLKLNFFSYGFLFFEKNKIFSVKISNKSLDVSKLKKNISDFFQKN